MPGVVNDGFPETAPVGRFAAGASPFGLLDMAGNVWEWTRTPYGSYTAAAGSVTVYTSVDRTLRVLRGGSLYNDDPSWVRAGIRSRDTMTIRNSNVGFRCVREGT